MNDWWPEEYDNMTVEERRDETLRRMFLMPPKQQKDYIGKSIRIPRRAEKKHDPTPVKGYMEIPKGSLLDRINKVVPRIQSDWRDDIVQDIAVAILSGEVDESILSDFEGLSKFRYAVLVQYNNKWRYVSIDRPINDDKQTLKDLLQAETDTPEEIYDIDTARKVMTKIKDLSTRLAEFFEASSQN